MGLCLGDRPGGDTSIRIPGGRLLNGTVICIDRGRPRLVSTLNTGDVRTAARCCGRGDGGAQFDYSRPGLVTCINPFHS